MRKRNWNTVKLGWESLRGRYRGADGAVRQFAGTGAIDGKRILGDYEPARQAASNFFTSLRAETDRGNASALSPAQREGVLPLLTQRDEIITLLARGDPVSADQLSDLYVAYRKGVGIK
jgi:hypothetical protein